MSKHVDSLWQQQITTAASAFYRYGVRDGILVGFACGQGTPTFEMPEVAFDSVELDPKAWIETDYRLFGRWKIETATTPRYEYTIDDRVSMIVDVGTPRRFYSAAALHSVADAELFKERFSTWQADTEFESSMDAKILHPAYQRIIGMGEKAIPLILSQLRTEPDWLFWALESIVGENPAPSSANGDLDQLTAAWLQWGEENGYGETVVM